MVLCTPPSTKMNETDVRDATLGDDGSCYSHSSKESQSRRVTLVIDDRDSRDGLVVHEREPLSEEEVCSYYMQSQDFARCDKETKETILEWAKYQMGHRKEFGQFHTTRGLEDLLDQLKYRMTISPKKTDTSSRLVKKSQHVRQVLQEVNRQKSKRGAKLLDGEQIRRVSLELSEEARIRAKQVAALDAKEAWEILSKE
jgi:hypothetical protein